MKLHKRQKTFLLLLMLMLVTCFSSLSAKAAAKKNTKPKNGWYTASSGKKYYYKNGKKQTGWKKIKGYWYYLKPESGAMQKNQICPLKGKYYFVGPDGIMCKDACVQLAVDLVIKHSKLTDSKSARLKDVYDYMKSKSRYTGSHLSLNTGNIPRMAYSNLSSLRGECITSACGFAYIPLVLGYNTRIAYCSWHTWPEARSQNSNTWYVYDLSRETNPSFPSSVNFFKITYYTHYRYYPSRYYNVKVKKGKVIWTS